MYNDRYHMYDVVYQVQLKKVQKEINKTYYDNKGFT